MKCSICIASYDKPTLLERTLLSIFSQVVPYKYEVIVVDDGSPGLDTAKVCSDFSVQYHRFDREPIYRNPSVARNVAYRAARGEIIIAQSDDTMHTPGAIVGLIDELRPGRFVIADVYNVNQYLQRVNVPLYNFTGPNNKRPFFFLGALYRKDLYAVGGNDEDYVAPGFDDNAFSDALMHGLGLEPYYSLHVRGYHQCHVHRGNVAELVAPSKQRYYERLAKMQTGELSWLSPGGPWPWKG